MRMPKLGGEMFYWAVARARPAAAKRFIFFTGHQNTPAIQFFFKRINATVLTKPFKLTTLDSAIRDTILKVASLVRRSEILDCRSCRPGVPFALSPAA